MEENLDLLYQLNVADVVSESVVDGLGIRMTLFVQGCSHHCAGCHNPTTWDYDGGKKVTLKRLTQFVKQNPLLDGVTFSGGEPFEQAEGLVIFSEWLKANGYNIWSYTGYTLEELLVKGRANQHIRQLLQYVDVLVDGRFIEAQKDLTLKFRGSKNQRIIDMVKTRQTNYEDVVWLGDMN